MQPLGVMEILGTSFRIFNKHKIMFLLTASLAMISNVILTYIEPEVPMMDGAALSNYSADEIFKYYGDIMNSYGAAYYIVYFFTILLSFIPLIGNTKITMDSLLNNPIIPQDIFSFMIKRLLPVIGFSIVISLGFSLICSLFIIGFLVPSPIVFFLLFVMVMFIILYWSFIIMVAEPIFILEKNMMRSIQKAMYLTGGYKLPMFGLIILLILMVLLSVSIFGGASLFLLAQNSAIAVILWGLLALILFYFTITISMIVPTVVYYRLAQIKGQEQA